MAETDTARETGRALLRVIRRVRTVEQLDKVLADIVAFIDTQRTRIEDNRARRLNGADSTVGVLARAASHRSGVVGIKAVLEEVSDAAEGTDSTLLANETKLEQDVMLLCSMLAGALGRRADALITRTRAPASTNKSLGDFDAIFDVDGHASSGAATPAAERGSRLQQRRTALSHLRHCMEELVSALERLRRAAVVAPDEPNAASSAQCGLLFSRGSAAGPGQGNATAADATLTYGIGEAKDFAVHQRARAVDRLRSLTGTSSSSRWSIESIVEAVWEISEFSPPPVSALDTQGRNAAVEPSTGQGTSSAAGQVVEATRVVTPLKDPLSHGLIRTPCRGERCVHRDVFDAACFVRAAQRRSATHPPASNEPGATCPLCRLFIPLHALRVDMTAVAAMAAYRDEDAAAASSAPSNATTPAKKLLSADHCLEWDMVAGTCRVVEGKQPSSGGAMDGDVEEEGGDHGGSGDGKDGGPRSGGEGALRKRRRVEIGGHVLFVDE